MLRISTQTTCSTPQRRCQRAIFSIRCCISQPTLSYRQLTGLGSHVPPQKMQHQIRTVSCKAVSQQHTVPSSAATPAAAAALTTTSHPAAATPAAAAAGPYSLPAPPGTTDVGSLDVCINILQHHATPGSTWPQAFLQKVKDLTQDPNTLFLVVECGFWQESMGPNLSGKPARAMLLVTPRLGDSDQGTAAAAVSGSAAAAQELATGPDSPAPPAAAAALPRSKVPEYKLQVLAMRLDKDGWPDGTLWSSPSAFEANTTKVQRAYYRSSSVLLPPTSQPSSSSSNSSGGRAGSPKLHTWLRQFYGRDLKRCTAVKTRPLASKHTPVGVHQDLAAAAGAAILPSSGSSSESGSTTIKQQSMPVYSAQRRRAGLGIASTSGSRSRSSTECLGAPGPSSSSSSSRNIPSYQDAAAYRLDPATGRWPFYTYTQNWEALALIGQAVMASLDPKSMFDFVNSIDMKRLVLACDAEIAAGCPLHACKVYDLVLEVQEVRQEAAAAAEAEADDPKGHCLTPNSLYFVR